MAGPGRLGDANLEKARSILRLMYFSMGVFAPPGARRALGHARAGGAVGGGGGAAVVVVDDAQYEWRLRREAELGRRMRRRGHAREHLRAGPTSTARRALLTRAAAGSGGRGIRKLEVALGVGAAHALRRRGAAIGVGVEALRREGEDTLSVAAYRRYVAS